MGKSAGETLIANYPECEGRSSRGAEHWTRSHRIAVHASLPTSGNTVQPRQRVALSVERLVSTVFYIAFHTTATSTHTRIVDNLKLSFSLGGPPPSTNALPPPRARSHQFLSF